MALGGYYDVYTVPEYVQRVSDIKSSISSLKTGDFLMEAKVEVESQIERLKKKEQAFLSKIKIEGIESLEDLNKHLQNYQKATFNLNGSALYQTFIGILEEENKQEYDIFNRLVMDKINLILNDKGIEERGTQLVYQEVMNYLNQGLGSSKGIDVSFHSKRGFTEEGIFPAKFTKEQKKRWRKLLVKESKPEGISEEEWEIEMFSSNNQLTVSLDWFDTTQKLTQTEAQKLPDSEVDRINNAIKKEIIAVTDDKELVSDIIDHVLGPQGNKYAFFVGKNTKDITGILGEIQGLYYMSKLFGGDNITKMPKDLIWRGGTYSGTNSTKPHQDLLFETFGIQVKNSTKDLVGSINFANASIETMLNKTEMSQEAKNVFYNFYGTKEFNIPYHREGDKYVSGLRESDMNAKTFSSARNNLLGCEKDIEELLSLFAASFMYMDVAENFNLQDANTFYLIGGTAFYAASSILNQVLNDIEKEMHSFRIKSTTTLGHNIIDALNSKKGKYSDSMLSNIKLTSSFNFNSLQH